MDDSEYARSKVIEIASAMLDGSMRPLLGARNLVGYFFRLQKEIDPKTFNFIRGVSSECDGLPIGEERKYWAEDALRQKDAKALDYENRIRSELMQIAAELREKFTPRQAS
jgi:hypothetical protein